MSYAIAVTDKDILTVNMVCGTMTCCLELFFIAFEKQVSSTVAHVDAFAVEVRPVDGLAAAYGYAVVALAALAAVIPRYKEVVIAVVLEDERSFDGIRTCIVGCGILGRVRIDWQCILAFLAVQVIAAGDGTGLL